MSLSLPMAVPEDHIHRLRAGRTKNPNNVEERRARQRVFLDVFRTTATIEVAEQAADVPRGTYSRWRGTDPEFCQSLNECLVEMRDRLQSFAVARAIGYRQTAPDGTPLYDGDGKPVYKDGNDNILMRLIGLDRPQEKQDNVVVINIMPPSSSPDTRLPVQSGANTNHSTTLAGQARIIENND